ncbi:hypothetical protein BGZ49_009990 [Haplosporangium sp. Z 27]|nr:hypothetical protein BGZ49_009990 [Haplosporangium sp. Z 27]
MSWTQEQAPAGAWSRAATDQIEEATAMPPLLNQHSRFLLSPVPASAAQGPSKTTSSSLSPTSITTTTTTTITLYPVESLWIGMNLSDDLLQNELRRAYPAEGDAILEDGMNTLASFEDSSQSIFELSRMNDSGSIPGVSTSFSSFYESFNHLSPAQQHLLQQQQNQQRIAVLLESREMPKCPMCRTGLHISGWDRIEEHIKIPVSVSPRPTSSNNAATAPSSSEWMGHRGMSHGERPVSGVERRRMRSDRSTPNVSSRRRQEVIGEEDEGEEEEIEMEQVGVLRSRDNSNSNNTVSSHPSSSSSSMYQSRQDSRSDRSQQRHLELPAAQTDLREQYSNRDENDGDVDEDDEILSPTTAVIGRRPSEWMQYQLRQIQVQQERQQANRLRAGAAAAAAAATANRHDRDESPHPHALVDIEERYIEQQEQIRRLLLEQESQEEQLRTLTARAASIIEEQEQSRRRGSNSVSSAFASTVGGENPNNNSHRESNTRANEPQSQRESFRTSDDRSNNVILRPQPRYSQLQINTSLSRPSSHQNQSSENSSRQPTRESVLSHDTATSRPQHNNQDHQEQNQPTPLELTDNDRVEGADDSDDNSIMDAIQQGTRAWAQRPLSLRLSPNEEGDMNVSDSVSDSAMSSCGLQSSSLPLSPFNESTLSYRTSSTFSQSVQNNTSIRTSLSQLPSSHSQWSRDSLALQMPTLEGDITSFGQEESPQPLKNLMSDAHDDCIEQPWADHRAGEDHMSYHKDLDQDEQGEFSSSTAHEGSTVSKDDTQGDSVLNEPGDECCDISSTIGLPSEDADHGPIGTLTQGTSSGASLGSELFASSSPYWKIGSTLTLQDLDIHSPIVTAEGSMTTIADMQIDADILARARSNSALLSDEDMPNISGHRSPIDSPIPTPSTARPRRRFPAGIPLNGEDDDQADDDQADDDQADDEDDFQLESDTEAPIEDLSGEMEALGSPQSDLHGRIVEDTEPEHIPEVSQPPLPSTMPSIQDPLSAAISSPELVPVVQESLAEPNLEPVSSPLHLPVPTPVASIVEQEAELGPRPSLSVSISQMAPENSASNEQNIPTPEDVRPTSITVSTRHSATDASLESTTLLEHFTSEISMDSQEERDSSAARVREHIQYRTIVRYQPRLPKAHVMSDIISQIRVQCPHKELGCEEIMEMQKALQHGREKCQFRMVMCPRPRCGLWMKADQIVEHIMMVEPSNSSSPSSNSPSSSDSFSMSVRSTGRTTCQQRDDINGRIQQRSPRGQRNLNGINAFSSKQGATTIVGGTRVSSQSDSSILPCAGLTWEREQLARATGIIGQLNEENSSLRQTIRQLRMQNSKLLKDKDRWQRYANLGLGKVDNNSF